jgi:hypothetical protein
MQGGTEPILSPTFNSLLHRNTPAFPYISTRSAVREIFGRMKDTKPLSTRPLHHAILVANIPFAIYVTVGRGSNNQHSEEGDDGDERSVDNVHGV